MHQTLHKKTLGFTLAELLSALAILGVIATFTIPKVLNATQNNQFKAVGKEIAAAVSGAYSAYQLNNSVTNLTGVSDLTPYLNYVRISSTSADTFDGPVPNAVVNNCNQNPDGMCLFLANGALLYYRTGTVFNGDLATSALWFRIDPDAKVTASGSPVNGPGKTQLFWLYRNGRLTTAEHCAAGTSSNNWAAPCPMTTWDTDWFEW